MPDPVIAWCLSMDKRIALGAIYESENVAIETRDFNHRLFPNDPKYDVNKILIMPISGMDIKDAISVCNERVFILEKSKPSQE